MRLAVDCKTLGNILTCSVFPNWLNYWLKLCCLSNKLTCLQFANPPISTGLTFDYLLKSTRFSRDSNCLLGYEKTAYLRRLTVIKKLEYSALNSAVLSHTSFDMPFATDAMCGINAHIRRRWSKSTSVKLPIHNITFFQA